MHWLRRLFDFKGHAARAEYWAISIGGSIASGLLTMLETATEEAAPVVSMLAGLLTILILAVHAAVATRRLHDRGKSGWWALLFLGTPFSVAIYMELMVPSGGSPPAPGVFFLIAAIPIIGWAFVELGVLPGKSRGNRYVANPRDIGAAFE
ncbi:MAG: DUF805 domain-containing protein [Phenylobacterium sp.]